MANLETNVIWTSPKGEKFTIKTIEYSYQQKHIGEVKENPRVKGARRISDSNDTFTDLGIGGKDISLECFFIGSNHFEKSNKFKNALCETGKSKLQLAYGEEFTVNVLNFEVKNSLVEKTNATIITVNFHETSNTTYPKSEKSKQQEIKNKVLTAKTNLAQTVADTVKNISSPVRLSVFTKNFQSVISKISSALDTVNNITLNSIMTDILGQDIIDNAFTVISQTGVLFSKAATTINKVKNTGLDLSLLGSFGFGNFRSLLTDLKTPSLTASLSDKYSPSQIDELKLNDAIASIAIVSLAQELVRANFETRLEAVETVKNLVALYDDWSEFVDEQAEKIEDLSDAYIKDENVFDVVNLTCHEILEKSYRLKIEQTIVLSEDSSPLELAYKYYSDGFKSNPDETFEYFARTNKLQDGEFFLLPRGKEIKIYV